MDLGPQKAQRDLEDTEYLDQFLGAVRSDYPHRDLTERVIGAAIEVHRQLGSGFLEKVYETGFCLELTGRGIKFEAQVPMPISYKGRNIGTYFADIIVERLVL